MINLAEKLIKPDQSAYLDIQLFWKGPNDNSKALNNFTQTYLSISKQWHWLFHSFVFMVPNNNRKRVKSGRSYYLKTIVISFLHFFSEFLWAKSSWIIYHLLLSFNCFFPTSMRTTDLIKEMFKIVFQMA